MAASKKNSATPSQGAPAPEGGAEHHAGIAGAIEDLEVSDRLHPLLQFIVDHIKPLAAGLVLFLLVIAGYGYWEYSQKQAVDEASNKLGAILAQTSGEQRITALQEFLQEAPGEIRDGVRLELATTLAENGQYEKAAAIWSEVGVGRSETIRVVSAMGQAQALMDAGKNDEALAVLEDALAMSSESFAVSINRMIATAAEEAGRISRAVDALRELVESDPTQPQTYLKDKIARLEKQQTQQQKDS
ncbi:MAG: tetratricopeptide repeat protein [Oceanidesulfovibrio sp.]